MPYSTLDIETYTHNNKLNVFCIVYKYRNKINYFKNDNSCVFLLFLKSLNETNYCFFVHNLTFDVLVLLDSINTNCYDIKWFSKNYNIYQISFKYFNVFIEIKCSLRFLPLPLDSLSKLILKKTKLVFPYKLLAQEGFLEIALWWPKLEYFNSIDEYKQFCEFTNNNPVDIKKYLLDCCINDVNLLDEIIQEFLFILRDKRPFLISNSYSISSYALKYYFKKYNLIQKKLNKNIENLIRDSYYGGRCEVFGNQMPGEFVYHFDFSGMYSQCMKDQVPTKNFIYSNLKTVGSPGFYNITFFSNMYIPILPIRSNLLLFPNGEYTGTYWYEEVMLFIEKGGVILNINYVIVCDIDFALLDFSTEFDKLRNINECGKLIGKLVNNSFYGRLGIKSLEYRDIISKEPLSNAVSYIKLENIYINKVKTWSDSISNVAVAAAITSKARIKLYNAFLDVLCNGGRLLYCDTDSIFAAFTNSDILNKVLKSGLLFDTTKSDTIVKAAWFANTKSYSIVLNTGVEITKIKGISEKNINFNMFMDLFLSGKAHKFISQPVLHKKNYIINYSTMIKTVKLNNYLKRVFVNNYYDTIPVKVHAYNGS